MKMEQDPFPHVVVDNWWTRDLEYASEEIDRIPESAWQRMRAKVAGGPFVEVKDSISFVWCENFPAVTAIYNRLRDQAFIERLEALTGIEKLHFDTLGGGIHRISPGGMLGVHVDFNVAAGKWRRVNVLLYLSDCNGGELGLYRSDGVRVKAIKPKPARMVIFECSERSWHGHPEPLGDGPVRKSLAAYYFTQEAPLDAAPQHDTIFLASTLDIKDLPNART